MRAITVFTFAFLLSINIAFPMTPLTTELTANGFNEPLYVTSPPKDYDRLFVVEQGGKIKIIKNGAVLGAPFIDLTAKVKQSGNERGLLGLAFHPNYANNGFFYVNYTRVSDGATMVERYKVSGTNSDVADPNSSMTIIGPISQPSTNHNGGNIQFGPDGKLYIGMGDGGGSGDPNCNAQNGATLLGKMLRLNDDGTIPVDNPFVGNANVLDEIWSLGLRNPWRFSFDRLNGDLYIGDVGQGSREEIDFQPGASMGGDNYAWPVMEGSLCFVNNCPATTPPCNDPSYTDPIHEYTHGGGNCSINGGYVYRGCGIPDLQGTYFFADHCTAKIWSFRYDGSNKSDFMDRTAELDPAGPLAINSITSFGEDADGEIYIVDRGGEIFKIVADGPAPFVDLGFAKPGTGGVDPVLEVCGLTGTGQIAILRLRKAFPSTLVLLYLSAFQNPVNGLGGTLVPDITLSVNFALNSNAEGQLFIPFAGGGGPVDVYAQYLISDPGATFNVSFSNAVKVTLQP